MISGDDAMLGGSGDDGVFSNVDGGGGLSW
jgi:hypothetical protein